ncbi:hypothetical protein EOI86_03480 [Hwanghaeella grinnelliae]|uniref:Uncharacterized protein n=1 Tax=Hwanghaeella grinnelliae TaxID=2500179 RepID=A0A437QV09_9PROT|nr:hypothetical protein [Hwanghaeella grinnelliae]RVU38364.1 hypothetical protein EOI86_03480 [Hwanghaeella grinnelliae]
MRRLAMLDGATRQDRHAAIEALKNAVSAQGGWIEHHTFLSNKAMTLNFVMDAEKIDPLIADLTETGLTVSLTNAPSSKPGAETHCVLSLTFQHNDPDLRITVPAVG